MKQIQMVDLNTQYHRLKDDIDQAMRTVIDHASFINGPEVNTFARNFEKYLGVKHVIPCANGTDALQMALMALDLESGDEVITSNFTFIATVEVIAILGLKPVLVDVDSDTFNLLPSLIEQKITTKTKAIIPVHLFGQSADMAMIMQIAKKHNLHVIEDAAQCMGAKSTTSDKKLGTLGYIGCTSFFPSKNLGCYGDGGACMTHNEDLAQKLREIGNHGSSKKYYHNRIGINSRLDSLQAAILNVKLPHLDDFNYRRQKVAAFYDEHLCGISQIQIPVKSQYSTHVYHQYSIKVLDGSRDKLMADLKSKDIPTMVYYPLPIHQQKAFSKLIDSSECYPNSELLSQQILSLPMHTEMTDDQLIHIVSTIKKVYA